MRRISSGQSGEMMTNRIAGQLGHLAAVPQHDDAMAAADDLLQLRGDEDDGDADDDGELHGYERPRSPGTPLAYSQNDAAGSART